ncbi:uncharacterized protein BDV17DRAFT_220410 [Aspergillus undulatus]|uniref:uncharacterized protein n=1 Tax=Aspergillus undulatus TaxID=1810928 RepID=UPI003CCDB6CB
MLTINLQDPHATYAQNDLVAGQVIFQVGDTHPLASQPVYILVEVHGRTRTKTPESGERYGQANLFWTRVAQFHGSQTLWPFSFRFPARASPVDPGVVDVRGWTRQITTIRSDHPLPPTFHDQGALFFLAAVEYRIQASVWVKSAFGATHMLGEQSMPIIYRPRDDIQLRVPTNGEVRKIRTHRTIKSNLFLSKNSRSGQVVRGLARSFLHGFKDPSLRCEIQLTFPVRVQLGEEIPCLVRVTPLLDSSTVSEAPPIRLTGFSIAVTGKTKVWVPGEADTDSTKSRKDVILDKSSKSLDIQLSPERVIIGPAVQGTAPTIKTYNISRTYTLCIAVDILVAGVTSCVLEETELIILPGTGDYSSSCTKPIREDFDVLNPSSLPPYSEAASQTAQVLFSILGG